MQHDAIAVIDFGGQYAHLIATKVRRQNVLAEICQPDDSLEKFKNYKGIILSGSPSLSAFGEDSEYNKGIYELELPILGFCFGHQEIAKHYGGRVIHGDQEWGHADLHVTQDHPLFKGLSKIEQVWMSHFDSVVEIGPDFVELGYSTLGEGGKPHRFAAIGSDKYKRYGFQYHPEVDDTVHGDKMIANFVREICGCKPTWTMEAFLDEQLELIRQQAGEQDVFLLISGGVDSTVAAKVIAQALGPERLYLLHVDNGMMRKGESQRTLNALTAMGLDRNLHFIDASEDFLKALDGVIESEEKRKVIGNTFVQVFEREARKHGLQNHLLGQGTIYPDTIETGGTKRADTIKTHHNRVPVIDEMIKAGRVVEPLADLYKVEVRELGENLGIPHNMIWRHPFPGPGLGVRLLCSNGEPDLQPDELRQLESAAREVASSYQLEANVLPIKSVGVKADLRSFEHPVLLHGLSEWRVLKEVAGKIYKGVPGINRCLWNLGPVKPQEIRLLAAQMTRVRLDLLRELDAIVMQALRDSNCYERVWQCPTVLVPLCVDDHGKEFCIIRPVNSERGMTATAAELPIEFLHKVRDEILTIPEIAGVAYDITSKPPGTIEWE